MKLCFVKSRIFLLWLFTGCFVTSVSIAQKGNLLVSEGPAKGAFPLAAQTVPPVYYSGADAAVVGIAVAAFAKDIQAVTGTLPAVKIDTQPTEEYVVIAGTLGHSALIDSLIHLKKLNISTIQNGWEQFIITTIDHPFDKVKNALVIVGCDRRGTAFGIFHLSKAMGVSPLVWWADVTPATKKALYVSGSYTAAAPSVKYRGIFINDEDWGLQPWAAKNMDKDIKDIGPNTYAKVFELLLRLKANYIWPAMHPCTKAFYYYKENPVVADQYAIVVGGSHCEPMLRNNVFEWAENYKAEYGAAPGEWRYDVNGRQIYNYWGDRMKEARNYESLITVGMRGVHDGSMPGPKDPKAKTALLEKVIADQRTILSKELKGNTYSIPQVFIPYKEVLSLYKGGLKVPDDVTIMWPDDNYGYIRQLPSAAERKRSGGHGVYYHLSYWGSPHDYLWLSTQSPALISYEMTKAYNYGANKIWIFNVGDIKPAEMELQFCMDMAWDIKKWNVSTASQYTWSWASEIFGASLGNQIADLKKIYYMLAATAKPEHLGLVDFFNDGIKIRTELYDSLISNAYNLKQYIPDGLRDAYFELIEYPIVCAGLMNRKIFSNQKSCQALIKSDTAAAKSYFKESEAAFIEIKKMTEQYNTSVAGGKWNGIMSWHPRDLPVFKAPVYGDTTLIRKAKARVQDIVSKPIVVIGNLYFSSKRHPMSGYEFTEVKGLGINPYCITLLPKNYNEWPADIIPEKAYLEYSLSLPAGTYSFVTKWLPDFNVSNGKRLAYAIAVNGDAAQKVNIHAEAESTAWKENVLQGYAVGTTNHTITKDGKATLRVYFNDTNLVLNTIEVYKK